MDKKNILFVLQTLPWPLAYGGNQAMFNGVAALVDVANVYVTYRLNFKDTKVKQRESFVRELGNKVMVLPYVEKHRSNTIRNVMHTFSEILDDQVFRNDTDCFLEKQLKIKQPSQKEILFINQIIENYKIDIVQVDMLSHLAIVNSLPENVKKVFVHHELGFVRASLILKEVYCNEYYRSIAETMKIQEIGLLNKYDDVVVLSEIDGQKLKDAGVKVPVHTSFAVVNQPKTFNPVINDYHNLFYIGPSSHRPNFYAIKWFMENCWEELLKKDNKFQLKIIGNWDRKSRKEISSGCQNVEFLGFVKDLASVLKNGIMIVPIMIGSGIRMKILEAAANGVPVVSTTVGAEGLPIEDGKNGFLADDANTFVEDILKLSDKSLRNQFVQELDTTIREKYSLDALKKNRCEIFGLE